MNDPQPSTQGTDLPVVPQLSNQRLHPCTLLMRWLWLPFFGGLIGLAVGCWNWIQAPALYKAVARIQVVSPGTSTAMPMIGLDPGDAHGLGRADDVVIIQSSVVLRNAIEIGRLMNNPNLSNKTQDELMTWLRNRERLAVRPGTKEATTNIIEVAFRCDNADLAAECAIAIIAGYEKFIGREAQALSSEVLDKLARFRDDYDIRAKQARDQYLKLTKATALIRVGDEFKDPDTEALLTIHQRLGEIRSKAANYTASIETAEQSMKQDNTNAEAILSMLSRIINAPAVEKNSSRGEQAEKIDWAEKLSVVLKSMNEELTSMNNQERQLAKMADEHLRKSKEHQYAIVELDVIRQEMNSINESANELKSALERLQMGTGYGGKVMKRLEVPTVGQPDGPELWKYLALSGLVGALSFACLLVGIFLIGSIRYIIPQRT